MGMRRLAKTNQVYAHMVIWCALGNSSSPSLQTPLFPYHIFTCKIIFWKEKKQHRHLCDWVATCTALSACLASSSIRFSMPGRVLYAHFPRISTLPPPLCLHFVCAQVTTVLSLPLSTDHLPHLPHLLSLNPHRQLPYLLNCPPCLQLTRWMSRASLSGCCDAFTLAAWPV